MQELKKVLPVFIIIILSGFFVIGSLRGLFNFGNSEQIKNLEEFSKCLAAQNIVMYGNWWCGACEKQKELFGKHFKNVKYIECSKNTSECINKNIEYTPTWIFPSGEKLIGLTSLEILSEKSSCPLKK